MSIFKQKTKKRHIRKFEIKLAKTLEHEFPEIKKALRLSKLDNINFTYKPKGISLQKSSILDDFEVRRKLYNKNFNLSGISIFNKMLKKYQPIKLTYVHSSLNQFEIENPEYFHRYFDLNRIKKINVKAIHFKIQNPDKKIAEKLLKMISKEQLETLDLEYCFEIEFDNKLFYTILDMEDGNYIATDKKGSIYKLNHDDENMIQLISQNAILFFDNYENKEKLKNLYFS